MRYAVENRDGRIVLRRLDPASDNGARGSTPPEGYQVIDRGGFLCLRRMTCPTTPEEINA